MSGTRDILETCCYSLSICFNDMTVRCRQGVKPCPRGPAMKGPLLAKGRGISRHLSLPKGEDLLELHEVEGDEEGGEVGLVA